MQPYILSRYGALPSQVIRSMMRSGFIEEGKESAIAPASLDLTISNEIYKTEGMFQLRPNETVRDLLSYIKKEKYSLEEPLEVGQTYLVRLNERVTLPAGVYGYCNPKSSTGRVDVHVRVLADKVPRYDSLTPAGWSGELWMAVNPKSFSVILGKEQALAQLRLFTGDTRFSELDFIIALRQYGLILSRDKQVLAYEAIEASDKDGAPVLSLEFSSKTIGWVSKKTSEVLDLRKIHAHNPRDFFEEVAHVHEHVTLKKNNFYILSTDEAVRVPPDFACEMAPMDERSGDFRSHYAGFIDPGWGWGFSGERSGRPLTLEVRPFEDLVIRKGQPIAKIRFERMTHTPDTLYDTRESNYTTQSGPCLAMMSCSPLLISKRFGSGSR
jgi:dCTP deaminase